MIESRSERTKARLRYADVLEQCRDMVVIFSNAQLTELFEHAGAALLDFAERAENNTMQGHFFEAMGLIQRRRADMEHIFRREINKGFDNFGSSDSEPATRRTDPNDANSDGPELSLVEPEEMEESLATENLIIKANANYFPELYALSQRLAVVNGGRKLKDYEIPAGPHQLVHALRHSMEGLDVEVRIKVILYALFDKFVVKQAKSLYDEFNGNLKDAGILPNLKPVHVRPEHPDGEEEATPGAPSPESEQGRADAEDEAVPGNQEAPSLGTELFDSIIELMSTRQSRSHGAGRRRSMPSTPAQRAEAAAASRDLVNAVDQMQSRTTPAAVRSRVAEAADIPNLEVDTAFIQKVKETLSQEREQVLSQVDRDKLAPVDADLIDLIGMLFEYMLNDPVLPNLAKALLSHLHTPYLKVALIDRRLLVDEQHPARRLLDQMVEAGSLWVDESNPKHGIFPAMQEAVDRVLQEFTNDVALFEELLADFEQSMNEQKRKTATMEQRTQDAARGREKLQLAKRRANHQIQDLLQRAPLPKPVTRFLRKTWLDQLVFILLRDKEEDRSEAWKQAVNTADDLVALFEPGISEAQALARADLIPDLRERITASVRRMGSYTRAELDALFELMDAPNTWQKAREQAAAASPEEPRDVTAPETFPKHEDALAAQGEISEQEKEVIKRLRKMKFGTWFEFSSDTGAPTRRIKLSWLSPLTSTCMFVDRSGMQAEIKTLQELAHEILSGRAKVIPRPKHPFIERTLVSIRKMLRSEDSSPTETPQQQ